MQLIIPTVSIRRYTIIYLEVYMTSRIDKYLLEIENLPKEDVTRPNF